jgi:hypothetical protein
MSWQFAAPAHVGLWHFATDANTLNSWSLLGVLRT